MIDKSLAAGFLQVAIMGLLSLAFFTNSGHAYARCTAEDVKTGNCRLLPAADSPSSSSLAPTDQNPLLTPQTIQECKDLGISPEKCSEQAIASTRCLGGVGIPCGPSSNLPSSQPELSLFVVQILAGSGIAFVASIFGIRKLRTIKREKGQ